VAVAEAWAGSTILVSGGAGAVGHYAIQFAKARGAVVITTVSSAAKARLAEDAGADHVIDYKRENVGERVMELTDKSGVDAVIELDLSANAKLLPGVLRPRGTVVIYGTGSEATVPAQWLLVNAIALKFIFVYELTPEERHAAIDTITRMLEEKRLASNVAATLPLSDIVAAHEMIEQGKAAGNVVVRI
jgi:NADPH2:quinone reductase